MKLLWNRIYGDQVSIMPAIVALDEAFIDTHCHDFWECYIVLEGRGQELTTSGQHLFDCRQIHFVAPQTCHGFNVDRSSKIRILNISVNDRVIQPALALIPNLRQLWTIEDGADTTIQLDERQFYEIQKLATQVAESPKQDMDALFFLSNIGIILREQQIIPKLPPNIPIWLKKILLKNWDLEGLSGGVPQIVKESGMTTEHVCRSFRKFLGMSPSEWINQARVRHACQLLRSTDLKPLEVALLSGYESLSHFYRNFNEYVGKSPSTYRKEKKIQ